MFETPTEGKPEDGGQEARPVPSQPPAQPSTDSLPKWAEEFQAQLRALQSEKDKRWNTEVAPMKDAVTKIAEKLGIDAGQVQKAQRELALDAIADERLGVQPENPVFGKTESKAVSVELQAIEAALDLPANDARVTDLKLKFASDPAAFLREGVKLAKELATAQPTPAEQLMPDGGPKVEAPETDAQKRARIFGKNNSFFDDATVRKAGGGPFK